MTPTALPHHIGRARRWWALLAAAAALSAATPASAQTGVQRLSLALPRTDGGSDTTPVLVFYPTAAVATHQQWGPFGLNAAPGAEPLPGRHPLLLMSHGTGGNELGHAWLAEKLVAAGYLVAALRHPGDNYEDRSLVGQRAYLSERPRQVSRTLDALLADPRWAALIDAQRVAAFGHSAGGHSVLALAGAEVDAGRLLAHCGAGGVGLAGDPVMCAHGGFSVDRPAPAPPQPVPTVSVRDGRIRAVIAEAPLVIGTAPASWSALAGRVRVSYGSADEQLNPALHAGPLCRALPAGACRLTEGAGHFAAFQTGTGRLGPPGLDPAWDPAGFDRAAWQAAVWPAWRDFLASALAPAPGDAGRGTP